MSGISSDPNINDTGLSFMKTESLMRIGALDEVVYSRILDKGVQGDAFLLSRIVSMLEAPKIMTKQPKSLPKSKTIPRTPATCEETYKLISSMNLDLEVTDGYGTIDMWGEEILAEVQVVRVVKVLLEVGYTKDYDRFNAVRDLLSAIVKDGYQNKMFSVKQLKTTLDTFRADKSYYNAILIKCIDEDIADESVTG